MAAPPRPTKTGSKPWLKGQADDLASLANLDEPVLLEELRVRYDEDKIYTYVGDILVAVNPFRSIPLYTPEIAGKYNDSVKSANPPHIFAIADQAYFSMVRTGRPQCAVISGESGAGKTESAKYMVKHIINLCHSGAEGAALERKIIQVNPLLEAFGNAQTLMNNNSSRFGKYTELKFNSRGSVVGAQISEYLLEKSRVVGQAKGECSFHIFYYLFGAPDAQQMGLRKHSDFPYTANEDPQQRQTRAGALYKELVTALNEVGFSNDEQRSTNAILAAILQLGLVTYDAVYSDNDPAQMSYPPGVFERIADLLKVEAPKLKEALMVNITTTRGEVIRRPYLVHQAVEVRDAFSKALYGRLFGWIVSQINKLLAPSTAEAGTSLQSIGILDIFGFEHFQKNGFEQLCINVANEQLQNFFNQHIFKSELEEYKKEGIDPTKITFTDNQALLDLFLGKPIGVFALLDEESHFPKGTDTSLVAKYKKEFSSRGPLFTPVKTDDPVFTIAHYAGQVTYTAHAFLEKNRDTLAQDLITLCQHSKNPVLADVFLSEISATGSMVQVQRNAQGKVAEADTHRRESVGGPPKRAFTVSQHFTHSLRILVDKMLQCNAHFVRCIKPNTTQSAKSFVPDFVQAQLRYTGMLETTRIRREGYSYRPPFADFMERFGLLAFSPTAKVAPSAAACDKVMKTSGLQGWLMGKSKVFLKYWHVEQLDKQLRVFQNNAVVLQQVARGFLARRERRRMLAEQVQHAKQSRDLFDLLGRNFKTFAARLQSTAAQDAKRKASGIAAKRPPPLPVEDRPVRSEAELKREASVLWWKEKEAPRGAGQDAYGNFLSWFHGIISRKEAERLLAPRNPGTFLVRVSENRFGYTLSYRISDRCKHYIVEQDSRGRYALVGVDKVCSSLNGLIEFFQRNRINEDGDILREPCGQEINDVGEEQCDYGELLPAGKSGFKAAGSSSSSSGGGGGGAAAAPPLVDRGRKPTMDSGAPPPVSRASKPAPPVAEEPLPPPPPSVNRMAKPR